MLAESGFWLFVDIKTSDLTSSDSFPELFFQAFQHLLHCVLGRGWEFQTRVHILLRKLFDKTNKAFK